MSVLLTLGLLIAANGLAARLARVKALPAERKAPPVAQQTNATAVATVGMSNASRTTIVQ